MSPLSLRSRVSLSVFVCLAACSAALAGKVRIDLIPGNTSVGGPFKATVIAGFVGNSAGSSFTTFCLERGETFVPGRTYDVVISDRAVGGDNGGNPGGFDLLDSRTAYLYSNFRHGTLGAEASSYTTPFTFNPSDMTHVIDLQRAIWSLEGEPISMTTRANQLVALAGVKKNGSLYDVRVMQLWEGTQRRQDQLVLVPLPAAAVAGLALFPVSFAAGYLRRRRAAAEVA